MPKQITREQLLIELTRIRDSHADWVTGDENRRKEFAKAFRWLKSSSYHDEPKTPTWPEIFVEVGKLLELRNNEEMRQTIKRQSSEIDSLLRRLDEMKNSK